MGITLANAYFSGLIGSGNPQTVSIPAGATVAVVITGQLSGTFTGPGSVSDSGGSSYTAGNFYSSDTNNEEVDTFYCLNANSSTTITYLAPSGSTTFAFGFNVWVLTASGGTISFSSSLAPTPATSSAAANGESTGNLTGLAAGSIICGSAQALGSATLAAGTVPLMTQDNISGSSDRLQEHAFVSTASPCTWTASATGSFIMMGGIGFNFSSATNLTPGAGSATLTGAAGSMNLGMTPLTARPYRPGRKIILPPWRRCPPEHRVS